MTKPKHPTSTARPDAPKACGRWSTLDCFVIESQLPGVCWEQFGSAFLVDSSGGEPYELKLPHRVLTKRAMVARQQFLEDVWSSLLTRLLIHYGPKGLRRAVRRILNRAVETSIITLDQQGVVTDWSEGALRMLGWSEVEMLGESLDRIFPEEVGGRSALQKELETAASGSAAVAEGWRQRKSGERFWAIGEMTPLEEANPAAGFLKVIRDRTERRLAELKLTEQAQALEVLNRTGAALARETDIGVLVQTVTDAGVKLTGAEFGAFFYNVLDAKGESYMLYSLSGVPREAFSKFPMPRNTAVFAPTFGGDGIVRSDDITKDARYGHNDPHRGMPKGHLPVRSYLAVPVVSRTGGVIGGLFFGHSEPNRFDDASERSLAGLAGEAAVAIDNVQLNEATQKEVRPGHRGYGASTRFLF